MASAAEQLAANMNFGAFQKATELHKRLWFTLVALIVYRLGTYIPIPGIDPAAFAKAFEGQSKGLLGMFDMFSGGAVARMAIFSLNVMPYISASIIVQLLGTVYPPWEKLRKEGGEAGRKQLNQYTRYLTVLLAIFQSFGIAIGLSNSQGVVDQARHLLRRSTTVTTLTTGTMFLMWLGEQITSPRGRQRHLADHLRRHRRPRPAGDRSAPAVGAGRQPLGASCCLLIAAAVVGVIVFIVFMERSQRRLLVLYPKRQMGNRMFGGETSLPAAEDQHRGRDPADLRLQPAADAGYGAELSSPIDQAARLGAVAAAARSASCSTASPPSWSPTALMIIFFSFFYTSIVFNPEETAENLRKYGGNLPGIRPGKRTAEYIDYVLTRLTVIGAAYITAVCLLPEFVIASSPTISSATTYFGGTSILIVVTVTMDTVAQIQSHLLAHQYEGLIRKSKLRGAKR